MRIEILHIDDCPNTASAGARIREAVEIAGTDAADIRFTLLTTPDEAGAVAFAGSPTILIDGMDAVPDAPRTADLACRVYRTDTGLAGVPTVDQLVLALRAAIARGNP